MNKLKADTNHSQPPGKCHLHSDADRGADKISCRVTCWQMATSAGREQTSSEKSCKETAKITPDPCRSVCPLGEENAARGCKRLL